MNENEKSKRKSIESHFEENWENSITNVEELLKWKNQKYYLEAILILSCYIGALSAERYPKIEKDRERYIKVIKEYSDLDDTYRKIDLLFFYQWDRSAYKNDKYYKKLKNYAEIRELFQIQKCWGNEDKIKSDEKKRYKEKGVLIEVLNNNKNGFDIKNFEGKIDLFSLYEILYRFVRCHAVHEMSFPLLNPYINPPEDITRYRSNHKITAELILETVKNIIKNLKGKCVSELKWPYEL